MNSEISVLLKEYGLNDKEIALYMKLVGSDRLTAYELAKQTKIHRSTTYDSLARLVSQGFVGSAQQNKKNYYFATSPNRLLANLKSKEALLQKVSEEVRSISQSTKTTIQYLEGVESQKQFNIDTLERIKKGNTKEVLVLGNGPSWTIGSELLIGNIIKEFQSIKKQCKYRAIWDYRYKGKELSKKFDELGEQRYTKLPSVTTTVIMDNDVALLFTTDSPRVIWIHEHKVALEMKAYFEHLWRIAK